MAWSGTKVLVTGAGGFIASHLVERLIALGAQVTAFVRYNSRNDPGLLNFLADKKKEVRIIYGDIRDLETVRGVVQDIDVVFHLAALVGIPYSYVHPNEVVEVNTIGTLNVLTASKDRESDIRVIVTSSSEVYGTARYTPIDEKHPRQPQSPYAASKIAADAIARSFHDSFQLPVTIVRPFNTFGPRQSDRAIIPAIISQALTKDKILIGNSRPTRDFTFVADIVEGFIRSGESEKVIGQELNLGSGGEISIGDLAKKIVCMVGRDLEITQDQGRVRPGKSEVERLLCDNSKARSLLGWEPKVGLDEGLRLTIAWVRERLSLYDPHTYRI